MTGQGEDCLLARLRRSARLTQEELAERCNLSVRAISKLESGHTTRPRRHTLAQLGRALGLNEHEQVALIDHYRGRTGPFADESGSIIVAQAAPSRSEGRSLPVPEQLPPRATGFVGRDIELAQLRMALAAARGPALITGLGGIGKSALAVEVCAGELGRYPGGCLYANLVLADGTPREPGEIITEFLRALDVPLAAGTRTDFERVAAWRSAVADRRVLVLLEDAVSEDQVRPLLIGDGGQVVVTSRTPLAGLDAGIRLRLEPIDDRSSAAILTGFDGAGRSRLASSELADLVDACAGMPLALKLLAARLSMFPHVPIAVVAGRLAQDSERIDELVSGDRSVRHSVLGSLGLVTSSARQALIRLAQLDLPSFGGWLMAPVCDCAEPPAAAVLNELISFGLVEVATAVAGSPRYRLHDLVRAIARDGAGPLDPATLDRVTGWAVHLTAAVVASGVSRPVPHVLWPPRPAAFPVGPLHPAGSGRSWFEQEWLALVALTGTALHCGQPVLAGALLAAVRPQMTRTGRLEPLIALAQRCAQASPPGSLARACAELAVAAVYGELGRPDPAVRILQAIMATLQTADTCTLAGAWYELGWAEQHLGRLNEAERAYAQSKSLYASMGYAYGELGCVLGLAEVCTARPERAGSGQDHVAAAMDLAGRIDDYRVQAKMRLTLGRLALGSDSGQAVEFFEQALHLAESNDDQPLVITSLIAISEAERGRGRPVAAIDAAERAVQLCRALDRTADLALALAEHGRAYEAAGVPLVAAASRVSAQIAQGNLDRRLG